jgi:hypothetical protein
MSEVVLEGFDRSCRTVHKSVRVRGGGDLFRTTRCKASQICSIMFMSGELGGQRDVETHKIVPEATL